MEYLNETHQTPPRSLAVDGIEYPVRRLIELEDTATLALLGIYPHETAPGEAPLKYTDWVLVDGVYTREPAGTEAERTLAINQRKWAVAAAQRKRKQAQKTLSADPSTTTAAERAAALEILTGAI